MRGSLVLVDTSVFVSHLRGQTIEAFNDLLLNDQVYLSSYVRLELLQGVRQNEIRQLTHVLSGLRPVPFHEEIMTEAERILRKIKGHGLVIGIVDLLLASEANLERCPIFSLDRVFERLARLRCVAIL